MTTTQEEPPASATPRVVTPAQRSWCRPTEAPKATAMARPVSSPLALVRRGREPKNTSNSSTPTVSSPVSWPRDREP